MSRFSWWRVAATAALAAAVLAAAAVSAVAAPARPQADQLTVAIPNPLVNYAVPFVAKSAGIFAKYGLDVTLKEATGANTLNMLVTGDADISLQSTTQPLLLSQQGKQAVSFYIYSRDPGSWLIGGPGITSLDQAKALGDKCKILGGAPGQQSLGYGYIYRDIASLGLSKCSVESTPNTNTLLARLAAGGVTLATVPFTTVKLAMDAYGAKVLINPNLPSYRKKYNIANYPTGTWFGLKDNLAAKRPAIVRFVKAIDEASRMTVAKNLNQLTRYLQPYSSFSASDFNSLRTQLQNTIRYIGDGGAMQPLAQRKKAPNAVSSSPGYISKAIWDVALKQYAKWQAPGLDLSQPMHQYAQAVDMSYLVEAYKSKK
jgi:ABC-type nitrate/sulfonate/bicarbonate transport system substrate-binding protein